jgi:hypothetical protein
MLAGICPAVDNFAAGNFVTFGCPMSESLIIVPEVSHADRPKALPGSTRRELLSRIAVQVSQSDCEHDGAIQPASRSGPALSLKEHESQRGGILDRYITIF